MKGSMGLAPFVHGILPGAQERMGGGERGMLEVPRGQTVEISHAEGEDLNFILTAPGSHRGFKPKKNTVGFGPEVTWVRISVGAGVVLVVVGVNGLVGKSACRASLIT